MSKIDSDYLKYLENYLNGEYDTVEPEEELTIEEGLKGNISEEEVLSCEQTLLYLLVDKSDSMYNNGLEEGVVEGLKEVKDVINRSVKSYDIETAVTFFGATLDMHPFQYGECININYRAEDTETHLYDAIVESTKNMVSQYEKLAYDYKVKGVMLIITDGAENGSVVYKEDDVKKALKDLEYRDIPVLLTCFKKADLTAFANKFSYMKKVTFDDVYELRRMMRVFFRRI